MEGKAYYCDVCGALIGKDYEDGFWYDPEKVAGVCDYGPDLSMDACSFKCFVEHWGLSRDSLQFYHEYLWKGPNQPLGEEVSLEGIDIVDDDLLFQCWL